MDLEMEMASMNVDINSSVVRFEFCLSCNF